MFYLGMAILCSALVSTFMRTGEKKIQNNMGMFVTNYAVCAICSGVFIKTQSLPENGADLRVVILMGVISGILYLASFVLLQYNIRKNGVVLSATFMKLGVIIPTLMAMLVFRENPKLIQMVGMILAVLAIVMIHYEKEDESHARYKFLLVILLLSGGLTDSMANIYDKLGNVEWKDWYLLLTFISALICAGILWVKEKQRLCRWDLLFGMLIGIPNYFSSRFLLGALHEIPAVVVYPVYSVMTIVVISAISLLVFKEKLSKKKIMAMLVIFVSLILLNL